MEVLHRNLLNLSLTYRDRLDVQVGQGATNYASIAFDAAVAELWPFLIGGATIYPLNGDVRMDMAQLLDFIHAHGIEQVYLPPAVLELLLTVARDSGRLNELREALFVVGGDRLSETEGLRVVNAYGVSECAVDSTLCFTHEYSQSAAL